MAASHNVGRLPDWITFEQGATIGVGSVASATALFESLAIPWPRVPLPGSEGKEVRSDTATRDAQWILVWGASCVTGMMATQLAKLAGLRVFAVAGLHNAAAIDRLGAERVVDRHRPDDAVAEAKKLEIGLAIDCVGKETATYAARSLQAGGRLACMVKQPQQATLDANQVQATDILIKKFHEDENFGRYLVNFISDGIARKEIRPLKYEIIKGGLARVEDGLQKLQGESVSALKVVVPLD